MLGLKELGITIYIEFKSCISVYLILFKKSEHYIHKVMHLHQFENRI